MDARGSQRLQTAAGLVGILFGLAGVGLALVALLAVALLWEGSTPSRAETLVILAVYAALFVAPVVLTFGASWVLLARGAWRPASRAFEAVAWQGLVWCVLLSAQSRPPEPSSAWWVLLPLWVVVPLGLAAACVWTGTRLPGRARPSAVRVDDDRLD